MIKRILVKGPALSSSGYGEQTRFALRCLMDHEDKFEIFLINIPWGKTGHLIEDSEEVSWFYHLMNKTQQHVKNKGQFDISLQVTIPNEFEKIAPVNIGYTAGIETTKVAPQWIDKARLMDKIIVVSQHSKTVFNSTEYKAQNQQTGEVIDFKNTTPIEVIHFPVKDISAQPLELKLDTNFNFLSVAQWGPRKNVEATILSFLEEFKNDADAGLVLKLNIAKNSLSDKLTCEKKIKQILTNFKNVKCKIYLLHGNMSEGEMKSLYTHPKIKAIVSTTHGEGFGLPLFEAVCNSLPVIAPKWSGHVDFLMAPVKEDGRVKVKNHFTSIDFEVSQVNKESVWDGVIQADSSWCHVKKASVMDCMRRVFKNHQASLSTAKKLQEYVLNEFSEEKQKEKFLEALIGEKPVKISLEQIPKISLVTSVFKAKDYIEQLMEDVTRQSIFKEKCEWILLDANQAGDDHDELVIKKYCQKYPNIIYKRLESDPGIYDTWNMAIKMASGEFITNVNCDDRRAPNNLEKLAKTLVANPDVSLVYNDSYITHEPNIMWENIPADCQRYNFEQFSLEAMLRGNLPHNNPMWKKQLHNKFGYFDQKYKSAGDWDFWLRCAFGGAKFIKHPEVLGIYYFNPKGMSTNPEHDSWKKEHEKEIFLKYLNLYQEKMANNQ